MAAIARNLEPFTRQRIPCRNRRGSVVNVPTVCSGRAIECLSTPVRNITYPNTCVNRLFVSERGSNR
jgi:hypothetical protein